MRPRSSGSIAALACCTLLETACGTLRGGAVDAAAVEVAEVRRLNVCNTADAAAHLIPLADVAAVRTWQTARGVDLFGDGDAGPALPAGPFVMVEYGARGTAGYGLAIQRGAERTGNMLSLHGTFLAPAESQQRAPVATSPCVLVALPPGSRFSALRLVDQTGAVRARFPEPEPAPVAPTVPAQ